MLAESGKVCGPWSLPNGRQAGGEKMVLLKERSGELALPGMKSHCFFVQVPEGPGAFDKV